MKNFVLFIIAFMSILSASARAEIADTFNMAELSRSYAMTCEEQATKRHGNILPAYFPGRPQEFRNETDKLVVYSPYLTAREHEMAEKLFKSIPAYALPLAWRGGAVYVFVRRSIVEAVPALAVEKNWFEDYGLYMEVEKRLYLPFEKGEGVYRKNGKYHAARFIPTQREQFRVINHETGHMVDAMLGEYSKDSKGDDGKFRLSNRPDFLNAINSDLTRLTSKNSPLSLAKIRKLGYYMPPSFNGIRLGVQPTEQRSRREVFAELWAEAHGHNSNKLSTAYPDAFNVVKMFADFLKAQDAAAPVQCNLRDAR